MDDFVYDFGLRLVALRKKKGLKQSLAAKRLEVSASTMNGYEHNTTMPSLEVLTRMALFYGVSTDYLLGLDSKKSVCVDGLTERQIEVIEILVGEFKDNNK